MAENILFINSCARPDSRTYKLAQKLIETFNGKVSQLNLYDEKILPLDFENLEKRTKRANEHDFSDDSFRYAKQFKEADIIVIAAPFWDLSFPSVLKIYMEAVSVCNLTFKYSEKGFPIGLCNAKTLCYVTTAGGYIGDNNHGFSYIKALAENFYQIPDVRFFSAEGLDIAGADVNAIMQEAIGKL